MEGVENVLLELFPTHKWVASAIKLVRTHNPLQHAKKMEHFSKLSAIVNAINVTRADLAEGLHKHWNPLWEMSHAKCENNPLESVLGNNVDNVPKAIQEIKDTLQCESKTMFANNFKMQGGIVMAQFVILSYLYAQSTRTDETIKKSKQKLDKIKTEYIDKALELMYDDEDDEKHSILQDMSSLDIKLAGLYLKGASDLLQENIDVLIDKKEASKINAITGGVIALISGFITVSWFNGWQSLSSVTATNATNLCMQQGVATVANGVATAGLLAVAAKHGWNYSRCERLLDKMIEMKKDVEFERTKLETWIPILSREN